MRSAIIRLKIDVIIANILVNSFINTFCISGQITRPWRLAGFWPGIKILYYSQQAFNILQATDVT